MTNTVYTVHIGGQEIETGSAFVAELESKAGSKVTAITGGRDE